MTVMIKIKLTGTPAHLAVIEKSLVTKLKMTNMHAFDSECIITKYASYYDILYEFATIRLDLYKKRRAYCLTELKAKLPFHQNIVRFITQQNDDTPVPDLRKKTREQCDADLLLHSFDKIDDSYDYLMDLPFKSITTQNAKKHQTDLDTLKQKIIDLEKKTAQQLWLDDLQTFSGMYSKKK